ncbi:MAG: DUF2142 domain-containing protein [Chloroflexi bacterium]|nr:DUF2142 domain-containing protein [Chloroflexota bacterium]
MARAWILALALTLAQGLLWWAFTPPWTAPDEPGHYLYARLLADLGHQPGRQNLSAAVEAPILDSLQELDWWGYMGQSPPPQKLERLADDPVLAASGSQIDDEPPAYYIIPAVWLRLITGASQLDISTSLRLVRLWSLFLRLTAVCCALILASRYWPDRPDMVMGIGLLVGLLPMVGFIGGSFNNDVLTLAWGALSFMMLAHPGTKRYWPATFGVLLVGPILIDQSLLFLWPVALVWALLTSTKLMPYRNKLILALGLVMLAALLPISQWSAGWERYPLLSTNRTAEGTLWLRDESAYYRVRLAQFIANKAILAQRGRQVVLESDFQGERGALLGLRLADGFHDDEAICESSGGRDSCVLAFTMHPHATQLRVLAAIGAIGDRNAQGTIQLRLRLLDDTGQDILFNGDGKLASTLIEPLFVWLEKVLPIPPGYLARALAPSAWGATSQFRYILFAGFTWASFWGYFGWLTRPFPWWVYTILLLATLLAGWGILNLGFDALRRRRLSATISTDRLLFLSGLAIGLILVQAWLPMLGQDWQPQGRYLFPALLPIAILLWWGWDHLIPQRGKRLLLPGMLVCLVILNALALVIVNT